MRSTTYLNTALLFLILLGQGGHHPLVALVFLVTAIAFTIRSWFASDDE